MSPATITSAPFPAHLRVALGVLVLALAPVSAEAQSERTGRLTPDFESVARSAFIKLPAPPVWKQEDTATVWTADDLRAAFAKVTDTPPQINHVRNEFLLPRVSWINDYKAWFGKLERPLRMRFESNQWDCDNYANCFVTFADLLTMRAGERRGLLAVGWASVLYRRPFAGIPAGEAHAVVIVAADQGIYVIEPQDGTMIALEKFPNRDTFEMVYF